MSVTTIPGTGGGATTLVGTGSAESITGTSQGDVILGASGANTDPAAGGTADRDTLSGGGSDDTIYGGGGADSIDGGAGDDLLFGGDGNDTIRPGPNTAGPGDTIDGGAGDDLIFSNNRIKLIEGGAGQDTLDITGLGDVVFTRVPGAENTWVAQVTQPAGTVTITGIEFFTDSGGGISDDPNNVCFLAGTRILTSLGEKPVEALRSGDLVATVSGRGAPMKPVLWIGQRRIALAGNPAADALAPVRIRAGALGEATPHRDLLVSPDHCLLLDGALVPARLLVNGTSITVERDLAEVTYLHIELADHDAVLAEGAAAESWLDCGNRHWFANADVAQMQVDTLLESYGTGFDEARACAPLVHGGERLAAIRNAIDLRAQPQHPPAAARSAA